VNGALTHADIADLAHLLEGATGAEIMMAVRGARRIARYAGRPLERDDLLQAIAPPEDMPHATLNRICIHEAAHAVAAIVTRSGVVKRCIVGGAGAAGHTLIRTDPHEMPTRESVERRAVVLLCGRTAEQHIIGDTALGAGGARESDLARATQLVATLHASAGLGDTLTYLVSHQEALSAVREDRELRSKVELHLRALQARADELVHRHRDAIIAVADQLSTRRQLSGDEVCAIFDATAPNDQANASTRRLRTRSAIVGIRSPRLVS
jgi:ATP-dependent Zn protease